MTPFASARPALYQADADSEPEPVAIIALDQHEFLAVDADGKTLLAGHKAFRLVGDGIADVVWLAREALMGS